MRKAANELPPDTISMGGPKHLRIAYSGLYSGMMISLVVLFAMILYFLLRLPMLLQ